MQIYISRDGQQLGPYTPDDVTQKVKEGGLKPDVLAWCEGCEDWMPLAKIPGLSLPVRALPPPPPLSAPNSPPPLMSPTQGISNQGKSEALGIIALVIPVFGALLNLFWVGSMRISQNPASSLQVISVLVIIGTAIFIGVEAKRLGMSTPEDKEKRGKNKTTSPAHWVIGLILLWIVFYPLYFRDRARYGMKKMFILALLSTILFSISIFTIWSWIESSKDLFH